MTRQIVENSSMGICHAMLGGSLTLKNGRIDKYLFDEGYCQAEKYVYNTSKDNFTFCYYDRDHLGNIRQVREADGTREGWVIQTMNYYPFGAQFCHSGTDNNVQPYDERGTVLLIIFQIKRNANEASYKV